MAINALVSIGSYNFPTPSIYVGNSADMVDSARNVQGYVVGAIVRSDVAKIEMTWNYLTAAKWAEMLQKFIPAYGGAFYNNVTFFNQTVNNWETRVFYVGDRTTAGAFMLDKHTGAVSGYKGCRFNLIER